MRLLHQRAHLRAELLEQKGFVHAVSKRTARARELKKSGDPAVTLPSMSELQIRHDDGEQKGAVFIERDGKRIAQQTYRREGPHRIVIDHTHVDPSLQGQGIARRLLDTVVAWARHTGTRVGATCPYAKAQFEKDQSLRDVYDP